MADSDGPEGDSAMACSASDTRFCVRMQRGRLKRAERRRLVELGAWSLEFGALEAGKQASDGEGEKVGNGASSGLYRPGWHFVSLRQDGGDFTPVAANRNPISRTKNSPDERGEEGKQITSLCCD